MRLAVAHAATIPPRRTAPTRRGRRPPAVGPLAGPEAYGAAPPASRLLRIALRATALRAGRDPGASAAPRAEERAGPGLPPQPGPASGGRTDQSRRNRQPGRGR